MNERKRRANALMMKYYSGMIDEGSWKTAAGDIAVFNTKYRRNLKSLVVQLEPIQEGSGDPSPDNICPISGQTGATVYRTGKNLFDISNVPTTGSIGGISWAVNGNTITCDGTATYDGWKVVYSFRLPKVGTYHFHMDTTGNIGSFLNGYTRLGTDSVVVCTSTDTIYRIGIASVQTGQTYSGTISDIQIELGTTATAYEPYTGTTIPVSWETEAGTVYGGELDVVSGVLTLDKGYRLFTGAASEDWLHYTISTGDLFRIVLPERKQGTITSAENRSIYLCNCYRIAANESAGRLNGCFSGANQNVDFINNSYSTVEDWQAYLADNNIQFVYPLAEPITYQLTPQQIQTLLGDNVVWSDAGSVSVEYWS